MRILSIFNHYVAEGGEAKAAAAIDEALAEEIEVEKCEFHSSDWTGPNSPSVLNQALWTWRNPKSIEQVTRLQASFKADCWLIHNVFPVGSAAIYSTARDLGVPVVQYLHNFRPFSVNGSLWAGGQLAPGGLSGNFWPEIRHAGWRDSRARTAFLALVLSLGRRGGLWDSVAAWIAISDFVREKFIEAGIAPGKIHTLRHFWEPLSRPTGKERRHYLYIGRLIEAKGVWKLLEAWRLLENQLGEKTPRLVIAGDGPLRAALVERARDVRSVDVVGPVSGRAKNELLEQTRAMIVPSLWWEPLGLVVYEAYEYSVPVLAAASGGLTEIVEQDRTGFLHQPGAVNGIVRDVLALEANPQLSMELGRNGRRWLEQNPRKNSWRAAFMKIVNQVIARAV